MHKVAVKSVKLGSTSQQQSRSFVKNVPLVSVKVIRDKLHAYHAAQVNLMMLMVQLRANHVQSQHISVKKEETVVVFIVRWDGFLKRAVLDVKPVVRVHLVMDVNHAQ